MKVNDTTVEREVTMRHGAIRYKGLLRCMNPRVEGVVAIRCLNTCVKMIEDHYGQLLLQDKAHEIAGDKEWIIEKAKREAKVRLHNK